MSTIQIQKNWNPQPTKNVGEGLSNSMESDFFQGEKLQKNKITAEDLMGLSWVLFEDWSKE